MTIKLPDSVRLVTVEAFGETIGTLTRPGPYTFSYLDRHAKSASITMSPKQRLLYNHGQVHPIFAQHLPEGFVRRYISERLERQADVNDLYLLALQGSKGLGHLGFVSNMPTINSVPLTLRDITAGNGKGSLFADLLDAYFLNGVASGVQPKVLIPVQKSSTFNADFIVKSFDSTYPHLAVNEFVCMSAAKHCGIEVPNFWISDDQSCFVVERFDRDQDGGRLAMEDFTVLLNRTKYIGSYETLLKAAQTLGSPAMVKKLWEYIVFSCLVGNGDAHLKNFAILYDQHGKDFRVAPMYDVVNTLIYASLDNNMALKLSGSKKFPTWDVLMKLAAQFGVAYSVDRIESMADNIMDYLKGSEYKAVFPELFTSISDNVSMVMLRD